MAARKPATPASKDRAKGRGDHAGILADRMTGSLLPGDIVFDKNRLAEAAEFVLDAASQREAGDSVVEIASASDERRYMRIALVNDDMPFLVDSVAATVAAHDLSIDRLLHPVVAVQRNAKGALTGLPEGGEATGELRESMIYIETPRTDARERRELERDLRTTLADVRAAVVDWPKMREAMLEDAARLTDSEGAALLRWLEDGMLTQLGHVTRKRDGSHSNVLGICRKSARQILADPSFDRAFAWFDDPKAGDGRAPLIIKANRLSNVHRRVPLDLFIVPVMENGKVEALSIHAGVWTSASLATPPAQVPRLRTQLADLNTRFGFDPHGHAGKTLVHALTALPHDLVIGFSDVDIDRHDYEIVFPSAGTWYRHFNGDSSRYAPDFRDVGADRVEAVGTPPKAVVAMGRYSIQIFSRNPPAEAPPNR